jgi:hypothetical protein
MADAGGHAVSVEFDLMNPSTATWSLFDNATELRLDPRARVCTFKPMIFG